MISLPSEYHDYDIVDMDQPHHPAHPDYDLFHPAPVIEETAA
jgi:hypothetical protein